MAFNKVLRDLRVEHGLTQKELSKVLSVSESTIGMYERGCREPDFETLEEIADYFNVDMDFLIGRSNVTRNYIRPPFVRINVYGSVPAGVPVEAIQDVIDTEDIPADWCRGEKEYFGLRVKGDSMYPEYLDGDTVIVRKQEACESGMDAVVYVNGYEATLKKVKIGDDGSITLVPINQNYPPVTYTRKEVYEKPVMIAGVVVELRRKKI